MSVFSTQDPEKLATYAEEAAMVDASEAIAEALEASGISQADLARHLNISRSEVTARLRGERNITVRKLAATLHALGATLDIRVAEAPQETAASSRFQKWIDEYDEANADAGQADASPSNDAAVFAARTR
jgi:transcriptional regulator with XRE-family HTH domain